ncbi:DnaJ C-terminal domain-containing protein [Variovorax sp. J22R24]|uniref:DnaJ C-terminal domain-containing protein n=1 Tax=Variovorax gracilis TaxID=3053502 RepID=UPI002577F6EE|nr:DnaJ C-terminal domain-containing protein [Variovorax sp. J22R24]MDM0108243.1 DnaJ C-terminal domain-containing protein [Variovorax sp. J22R24]
MGTENAFAELGLAPDATDSEVKAAWRRLVSQWHPDRNDSSDAVAKMQRINQAFEEIRRAGSRVRTDDPATEGATPDEADANARGNDDAAHRHRRPIFRKVKLRLEEAAVGCIKVLRGKITNVCSTCAGAGHQVLGGNCAQCGGSGAMAKRSFFGWPSGYFECDACLGGGIARQPCPTCDGSGKMDARAYKIKVRIPHGVRHGDLLHVAGGRSRADSPPADLEIRVEVSDHAFFQLDADGTIRCEIPVDGFAWIANRSIQVPTVTGLHALQLDREQLSYRLKGQGFPVTRRGSRGDQVITLLPIFPDSLSTDQQILLDQLLATTSGDGRGSDARLRAWSRGLRAWERGMSGLGSTEA